MTSQYDGSDRYKSTGDGIYDPKDGAPVEKGELNILHPQRINPPGLPGEFYTPFGPAVGYRQLSKKLIRKLNKICDNHAKGRKKLESHARSLIGKVTEEPEIPKDIALEVIDELYEFLCTYIALVKSREIKQNVGPPPGTKFTFRPVSAWFVRQYANDYNPIHIHTGCNMSCIGYLKVPPGIALDRKKDTKNDLFSSHGLTEFVFTNGTFDTLPQAGNYRIAPEVGDFWVFPATLQHQVYPFKTKGERRSFSMNMNFDMEKITPQDTGGWQEMKG